MQDNNFLTAKKIHDCDDDIDFFLQHLTTPYDYSKVRLQYKMMFFYINMCVVDILAKTLIYIPN